MLARDFCYWLQGFFEITQAHKNADDVVLTKEQVEMIQKHLALVFKHDIDPSMGDEEHQQVLNEIHHGKPSPFNRPPGMRC